ncbi:MAG TPA: NAD(P)-dependent oxidoreductase [Patescibacteria group bacterium]
MKNFWKDKKVVITGAAGFIGSHVVKSLLKKDANITAVVSPKTNQRRLRDIFKNETKNISIKKVDLLDAVACLKITKGQDIVLNFAAMDGGSKFKQEHSAEIFRTNIRIVLNMLDAAVANNIDRFLLMSSIEVYSKKTKFPIKEDVSWESSDGANGYVWSKRFSEIVASMYAKNFGLKIAIARPGNVYGPGDATGVKKERVIPTFIHKVLKNETIELFDDGKQRKQFLYIDDLVMALLDLVEKYAICSPLILAAKEVVTIKKLANVINNLVNNKKIKIPDSNKYKLPFDITKAKKVINFNPKTDLLKGLEKTFYYYK